MSVTGITGLEAGPHLSEEDAATAFNAILDVLSRTVSQALIDRAGWARLRAAVFGSPIDPGAGFGFELRLDESAAGADYYCTMTRGSLLRNHHIRLGECAPHGSVARRLGNQLAALDRTAPWCELMGLEYDLMSGETDASPGLFARIRSDLPERGASGNPAASSAIAWLAGVVGWQLAAEEGRALGRLFDGVAAAGGAIDNVGIMPDRSVRAFKAICRPSDSRHVMRILEGLEWKGPITEIAATLSDFEGLFRSLRLAVGTTGNGILPQIGLELSQGEDTSFSRPGVGEWAPLLNKLCEKGLCLPAKLNGLLNWPGREFVFCDSGTFGMLTGIGHVKLTFDATGKGTAVAAKAYPAVAYIPFETLRARLAIS